jgi:hypothetical protein
MDIKGGLRIPTLDCDVSTTDPWTLARAVDRAGYRAGRSVEA